MPASSTSFKTGKSGNPGGRKKGVERLAREVAESRSYTDDDGNTHTGFHALMHCLLDIAFNKANEPRDRKGAIDAAMDRGWGKPKQAIEVSGEVATGDAQPVDWTSVPIDRRRQLLEAALELEALGDAESTEH